MFYLNLIFFYWCLFIYFCANVNAQNQTENEIRPYEFAFNIVDFQHRSEKKDEEGLITGEYGFVTLDGIYHETAYVVDKSGDFIVTKMRHRKITNLKDPEEIFRDKPGAAKKLTEALMKACASCELSELDTQESSSFVTTPQPIINKFPIKNPIESKKVEKKLDLAMKEMIKVLKKVNSTIAENYPSEKIVRKDNKLRNNNNKEKDLIRKEIVVRDMVEAARKVYNNNNEENERENELTNVERLEKMANDLFYQFNYTISSHGAWEDGFRDGRKDGEFNAKFKDGVDTNVKYVSNEFGYQPNITLVPREERDNNTDYNKGPYFTWFRK